MTFHVKLFLNRRITASLQLITLYSIWSNNSNAKSDHGQSRGLILSCILVSIWLNLDLDGKFQFQFDCHLWMVQLQIDFWFWSPCIQHFVWSDSVILSMVRLSSHLWQNPILFCKSKCILIENSFEFTYFVAKAASETTKIDFKCVKSIDIAMFKPFGRGSIP